MGYKENKFIVGRDEYLHLIENEFDKLLMGDLGLSIITGEAGVGKTYLVNQNESLFISNHSTYIKTKFNQHHRNVVTPMIHIIDEIMQHIFTLDKESFLRVKKTLKLSLRNNCNIILAICPNAHKIFDKKSDGLSIEDMHEEKLSEAIFQMIRAVSKVLFPLVIFIDDLHWADNISMNVIEKLCEGQANINIHLILAFRDKINPTVDERLRRHGKIQLHAFATDQIREYITQRFSLNIINLDNLIQYIYNLTKGNPFYLYLITQQMIKNNIVVRTGDHWKANLKKINNLELSKEIQDVILEQIHTLSLEEIRILQFISCFGGHIYSEMLNLFYPDSEKNLMEKLCKKSLLVRHINKNRLEYSFTHDLVYDVIYKTHKVQEKERTDYHIAHTLLNTAEYSKTSALLITSFILKVDKEWLKKEDAMQWIPVVAEAGEIAKARGNIEYALKIFQLCDYLIKINIKKPKKSFYLGIKLSYMQCWFINEKELEAKKYYEQLLKEFSDRESVIKIKLKYIYYYAYNADWENVLSLGSDILHDLGYFFNIRSIPLDLFRSKFMYTHKSIEKIKDAPLVTDDRILTILEVLVVMFPAANRLNLKMFTLVTLKLAILSYKHGNSKYSSIGYASYCYLLYFVFKDYKKGDRLQKITLALLNNQKSCARSIAYAVIGTFTYHWTNTFSSTLECLKRSIESGEEEGEYLYSNYAIVFSIITEYVMGKPLQEIADYINSQTTKKSRLESYLTRHMCHIYLSQITFLKTGSYYYEYGIDESKQSFYDTIVLNANMIRLQRLFLENKFKEAYALVKKTEPLVKKHKGFVLNGAFKFYSTITRIITHQSLNGCEQKNNKETIAKNIRILRKWADVFSKNHRARYLLAQAEYNVHIDNLIHKQEYYYYEAILTSKQERNIQLEAFANLLAARYYKYNHKMAEFYAKEASDLYKKWGANYIAKMIFNEFKINDASLSNNQILIQDVREGELLKDLSCIHTLSEEEACLYILNFLVDNQYADFCCILLEKRGEMHLKYSREKKGNAITHTKSVNMNYVDKIPHKVFRYVSRTEKNVMLMKNEDRRLFQNDAYLSENKNLSILCIPIKQMEVLTGIIYLEINQEKDKNVDHIVELLISLIPSKGNAQSKKQRVKGENLLTARETQILKLISRGMSNSQISEKLYIAEGTVRNHLSKVYSKLDVDNRMQAIIEAREKNII